MNKVSIMPLREKRAPIPQRGNARKVFQCLDEMGDWTGETLVMQFAKEITHSEQMSKHTAVKQALKYLTTAGYAVWQQAGRGREYKIAPLSHFNTYQGKYPAKKRRQRIERMEVGHENLIRDCALGLLWFVVVAMIAVWIAV